MPTPYGANPRPSDNFELYSWFFMRISGLLLVVLALGHVAIMHVFNTVDDINFDFVAQRWGSPFWRVYDMLLLILALVHGSNGLRIIIDDYVRSTGWRIVSLTLLYVVGGIFLVIGAMTILTFHATAFAAG